jgi:MraZ protein
VKPNSTPKQFVGNAKLNIDTKNRVVVPPLFRDILKEHYPEDDNTVMVTISMENTVAIYPESSFNNFMEQLMERSQLKSNVRTITTSVAMFSSPEKLDSAGKIAIPPLLKSQAQLGKEVYVVGCVDHFEIWPKERFQKYIEDHVQRLSKLGDELD